VGRRSSSATTRAGFAGGSVTIQRVRWWGFASGETMLRCDLDSGEGRRILTRLVQGTTHGSARATPLGAFVDYVKDARSVREVKTKCDALASVGPQSAA
jgi:hypothetical protein